MPTYPIKRRIEIPDEYEEPEEQIEEQEEIIEQPKQTKPRKDRTTLFMTVFVIALMVIAANFIIDAGNKDNENKLLQWDLNKEEQDHNQTQNELLATMANLSEEQQAYMNLSQTHNSTVSTLSNVRNQLDQAQDEIDDKNNWINNLEKDLNLYKAGGKYLLHDPTPSELTSFLENDTTNLHAYNITSYWCTHFASNLKNNASAKGIRCALVFLRLNSTMDHVIVGFNVLGEGFEFVEPQRDQIVNVTIGSVYPLPLGTPPENVTVIDMIKVW